MSLDLQALDEVGFCLVPGVLDAAARARLLVSFEGAAAGADGTQHVDVGPDTPDGAAWRALAQHPLALAAAHHLVGDRFTGFRVHGRNPRPGYGAQGLHADARPRRRGEPVLAVTALWMLDDFTVENGATRVVPGSHRFLYAVPRQLAAPDAHHPDEVVVTGAAGSVLVMNGHLWHAGRRNESDGPRRAVQMTGHVECDPV